MIGCSSVPNRMGQGLEIGKEIEKRNQMNNNVWLNRFIIKRKKFANFVPHFSSKNTKIL